MVLPLYLAMTAKEFAAGSPTGRQVAWMACHFACYETGLENLPDVLPEGAMMIVNDRVPFFGHDATHIAGQLQALCGQFSPSGILLDLQRPDVPGIHDLCHKLVENLSCPVGVSGLYAQGLDCPVFVPALPLRTPLSKHLLPWQGREIWLEVALEGQQVTVTERGAQILLAPSRTPDAPICYDQALHLCYHWHYEGQTAEFEIQRTHKQLDGLMEEAAGLGVTRAIGLYQQLKE